MRDELEIITPSRPAPHATAAAPQEAMVDAVVLAGGIAKRLFPLTRDHAKVLLPVAGRPALDYVLERVSAVRHLNRILLLVNQRLAAELDAFCSSYRYARVEIVVEPERADVEEWGPIEALQFLVPRWQIQDALVVGGDNLFDFDLNALVRCGRENHASSIAICRLDASQDVSEYGVVKVDDTGRIRDFQEKQRIPQFFDVSTACYYLRREELRDLSRFVEQHSTGHSFGSFIRYLQRAGAPIQAYIFSGTWFDIGTPEKLLEANRFFLSDRNSGVVDSATKLKGPVQIAHGARVEKSEIGPAVYIAPRAEISNSQIRNSIIMEGASVSHSRLFDTIVGPESTIMDVDGSFVLGPNTLLLQNQAAFRE